MSGRLKQMSALAAAGLMVSAQAPAWSQPVRQGAKSAARPDQRVERTYSLDQVSAWGGPVNTIVQDENLAFISSGERVVVLDLAAPHGITEIGSVRMRSSVRHFTVEGDYAYVLTNGWNRNGSRDHPDELSHRAFFHVVDIADPADPRVVWSDANHQTCQAIYYGPDFIRIQDGFAWIERSGRMTVYDLADPARPLPIASPTTPCGDVELASRVNFGSFSLGVFGWGQDNLLVGDSRVAGTGGSRLHFYDLASIDTTVRPSNHNERWAPTEIGTFDFPLGYVFVDMCIEGDLMYAVTEPYPLWEILGAPGVDRLWTFDISDPANPVVLSNRDIHLDPSIEGFIGRGADSDKMVVDNGRLYLAAAFQPVDGSVFDVYGGVAIYDIATDPGNPAYVGFVDAPFQFDLVFVPEGNTLFAGELAAGFVKYDVSDPEHPTLLDIYHSPARPIASVKRGDLLYISDFYFGLSILDVSDPSSPELVGAYEAGPDPDNPNNQLYIGGLDIDEDGYVYLAAGLHGLLIIDVSDPTNPTLARKWDPSDDPYDLAFSVRVEKDSTGAKTAYLLGELDDAGVYILNVTNPRAPIQIGYAHTPNIGHTDSRRALDFDANGLLYTPFRHTAHTDDEFDSYFLLAARDVSDPMVPVLIPIDGAMFQEATTDVAMDLAVDRENGLLWVASEFYPDVSDNYTIFAYDVSNPAESAPMVGALEMAGPGTGLGSLAIHPKGLLTTISRPDHLFDTDDANRICLLNTDDPAAPTLLASAISPSSVMSPFGQPRNHIHADASDIYLVSDWSNGRFGAGLSVFSLTETATRVGDKTTAGSAPGAPGYGVPDRAVTIDDLVFFINSWMEGDLATADVTGANASPDGRLTFDDLQHFIETWKAQKD